MFRDKGHQVQSVVAGSAMDERNHYCMDRGKNEMLLYGITFSLTEAGYVSDKSPPSGRKAGRAWITGL